MTTKYVYVISTGGHQWAYHTNLKVEPKFVFLALFHEIRKSKIGLVYTICGGHLDETFYLNTRETLKLIGIEIENYEEAIKKMGKITKKILNKL